MNNRDCQYFVNLYKTKNITHSAQQNFITQSSMTKVIQRLEEEFGCQLLLRNRKGVIFTAAGERLVHYCEKVLQMQREFQESIDMDQGIVGGSLVIGSSVNYCRYRLPAVLKAYTTKYPAVDISVISEHSQYIYEELLENKLSVAIIRGKYKWNEGLVLLASEPLCVVYNKKVELADLSSIRYLFHKTDAVSQYEKDKWLVENNLDTSNRIYLDDINSCMEMAQAGVGWSILPTICLKGFRGMVKPLIFKDGAPITRNTYIMYRNGQGRLPQVKYFIDAVLENEKQYPTNIVSPSRKRSRP